MPGHPACCLCIVDCGPAAERSAAFGGQDFEVELVGDDGTLRFDGMHEMEVPSTFSTWWDEYHAGEDPWYEYADLLITVACDSETGKWRIGVLMTYHRDGGPLGPAECAWTEVPFDEAFIKLAVDDEGKVTGKYCVELLAELPGGEPCVGILPEIEEMCIEFNPP